MTGLTLRGARILVTGGAGTIGSAIVDQLASEEVGEIVVLDNFVRGRQPTWSRRWPASPCVW